MNGLVSLHLYTAKQGMHWQAALRYHQPGLRRLHLIIDAHIDNVNLALQHHGRIDPVFKDFTS